jgi:hypothetical protein
VQHLCFILKPIFLFKAQIDPLSETPAYKRVAIFVY